jgi:hypothetical protein
MITEEEKVKARSHTGYLNVAEQSTYSLGIPAGVQTQFVIEGGFKRILPQAEPLFRRHLKILDRYEELILEQAGNVQVEQLGQIKINQKAFRQLVGQYFWWVASLANMMGITPNPFDQRRSQWNGLGGTGVNVGVSG